MTGERLCITFGRRLLFAQALENGNDPLGLFKYLAKKWAVPKAPQDFTARRSLHLNTDSATGAVSNMGFLVLEALEALVSRGAEVLDKLALLAVNEDGLVSVLHYLFLVGESAYKDRTGEIFFIRGEIPAYGLPTIVRLEAIHFAANSSFVGTPRLEFKGHINGLTSSIPWDFEDNAHHPVVEGEDDGACLVKSHGLAFIPCATANIALDQGPQAPITKVISRTFVGLGLQDRVFDPAFDWMQECFTDQADGTYARHICMCRDPQQVEFAAGSYWGNVLLAHLRSAFPGHFLPEPVANADRKEERVERNAGAEAGAAVGGAGLHAGAGAEGKPQNVSHSTSVGAVPLLASQMTIVWSVVGGVGYGAFRIPGCGARTGRATLGLLAQSSGATATAPGTDAPPG